MGPGGPFFLLCRGGLAKTNSYTQYASQILPGIRKIGKNRLVGVE
ncbi:hypothetical protein EV130_103166 [Rhizobium azibense]|uniref:Uncharacterized protein n=1 Tax=Rhizobium azibense TaxID=1136135 RepID=A0A4R3RG36_9HYPH|nr:hypothetical protein EV130_103166 [Rhizobium azibense]TCU34550.1 hypothetical protein EV129_112166 [Rhizobium azibense]